MCIDVLGIVAMAEEFGSKLRSLQNVANYASRCFP